jgi:hypothetical protein
LFELWRQDDNGQSFLVASYPDRTAAEERMAELTRCLHKQTYWITEQSDVESCDQGGTRKPCAEEL